MREARDGSGNVTAQYFDRGQTISGNSYFYTLDHLGSVREMTSSAATITAQYSYDSYGKPTKIQGAQASDFQYGGMYLHAPSGLNLAVHRAYNPLMARWLSRDPIADYGFLMQYSMERTLDTGGNPNLSCLQRGGSRSCPNQNGISGTIGRSSRVDRSSLYAYVNNSPVNGTDQSGLLPFMFCLFVLQCCVAKCGELPNGPIQDACGQICTAVFVICLLTPLPEPPPPPTKPGLSPGYSEPPPLPTEPGGSPF